jgi:hypothetical protein
MARVASEYPPAPHMYPWYEDTHSSMRTHTAANVAVTHPSAETACASPHKKKMRRNILGDRGSHTNLCAVCW